MIETYTKPIAEHKPARNSEIGTAPDILRRIHQKDTNIAIYKRDISALKREVQILLDNKIELRSSGSIDAIQRELRQALDSNGLNLITEDIIYLLRCFQEVAGASVFRLLLASVESNMCRKFHTDINALRMLCTYSGPGTLWLPDETTNSKVVQRQINNKDIKIGDNLIEQVETGHVVILKGALYPEGTPIMHRSPSIEETGEKRLLLRIDLNESTWNDTTDF